MPHKENSPAQVFTLTLGAAAIVAMSSALRNNTGIMLTPIVEATGISFVMVSFVLALAQLFFGAIQPAFGMMAGRRGNLPVLLAGVALTLAGMLLLPASQHVLMLVLSLGLLLPAGGGALSFGLVMSTIMPKIPKQHAGLISGLVSASHGASNIVFSPVITTLILTGGLAHSMLILAIPVGLLIPIAMYIAHKPKAVGEAVLATEFLPDSAPLTLKNLYHMTTQNRTYAYLMVGFFTCGFHMAIALNHVPTELLHRGFSEHWVGIAFSVYGGASIVGSVLSGYLCGKYPKQKVLAFFYGLRPVAVVLFLLLPPSMASMFMFTGLLGFSGAPTVPPVLGIIRQQFGVKALPVLFGFVFFVHQIGAFISAWWAGVYFDATGAYTTVWLVNVALAVVASVVSYLIKEVSHPTHS